ncbi:MAG: type II toxin-antitoxin system HicB family antitoxin [Desulfobacterium sp.]|jgi:predicted HicB family RNase H-like nuclease|nr:type II toxin-antitoxin system HicB family antitoxin [Desulfobacterium sp.]
MSKHLKYNNYCGSVEFNSEDRCLFGKILFINDLVTYEAESLPDLEKEFKIAVDEYLETCKALGLPPEKSYSGSFNVRVGEDLHKSLAKQATLQGKTINEFVKKVLEEKI